MEYEACSDCGGRLTDEQKESGAPCDPCRAKVEEEMLALKEDAHWRDQLLHEAHKQIGLLEKVADAARRLLSAESDAAFETAMGELEDAMFNVPQEPAE